MRRCGTSVRRAGFPVTLSHWATVSTVSIGVSVGLLAIAPATPAGASAQGVAQTGTIVTAISTIAYGSVLIGGGKAGIAPLATSR